MLDEEPSESPEAKSTERLYMTGWAIAVSSKMPESIQGLRVFFGGNFDHINGQGTEGLL